MIEEEIIKQYPSLVARPYLMIKDDFQRKDMQRFWFENTISFLAVLSAAELVKFYKDLKSKVADLGNDEGKKEQKEKYIAIIQSLQENKSLTMVGLEHMALGKWVMMLRETTKTLQEFNAANTIPELVEFYHGKNGKNNAKMIDKFVSIRNDDAHGNPIPEDKLKAELDKRQKIIDSLLDELGFLKNYLLILPEKLEIEGSSQFYICKQFVGNDIVNTKQTFEFAPQLSEVMLINSAMKDERLSLDPLLLYLGIQDDDNNFLGIFSKYSSKDETEAKYLNLDGSATIDLVNFGQDDGIDLMAERQSYSEIYSDPESFQVNLNVEIKFEDSSINIKEESIFALSVDNRKSTDIEVARVVMDIPKHINILEKPVCDDSCSIDISDNQLIIGFDRFEDNQKVDINPIKYLISEQGSYTLDGGRVLYSYYRTLADKESGNLTEEEIEFGGMTIEAKDKNSRDKMIPVVNINKGFVDADGNPIQNVKIGEDFIFKIVVTNIGFSSAKNVMLDLIFPDHINLKQGKETIRLGQLNPFEMRVFKYVLNSHLPNIYTIAMQNILYMDSHSTRYSTRCADEHFIIVRSDLAKEFVYGVKEHIEDLYIDEDEKKNITEMVKSLGEATSVDAQEVYKEAETEAVIRIIRDLVERTADKKELKIVEKIYEEGKRDSKITNTNPRKFLVFSSKDMPFFAINLSKGYEPEFFALRTNIDKRFDKVKVKQAVVREGSYTLDHSIDFSEIKYNEKYGRAFFNQWLNIVLTKFDKEYMTWKALTNKVGQEYGEPITYISGYFSKHYWDDASRESGVNSHYTLIDRGNSQFYYIAFCANATKNFKSIMQEKMKDKKYFTFLNGYISKDKTRLYGSEQLAYYMQRSDSGRATKFPAIMMSVKDDQSMDSMMSKSQELWEYLCLAHSLDLLESDRFSEKVESPRLQEFARQLFEKGSAIKLSEKYGRYGLLEIYSLKEFKPNSSNFRDAMAFIEPTGSGLKVWVKFFEEPNRFGVEILGSHFTVNGPPQERWIYSGIIKSREPEKLEFVLNMILDIADTYKKDRKAIWPNFIQKGMLLNYGQVDVGFFILLKNIIQGKRQYREVLQNFIELNMESELKRTIRNLNELEEKLNYMSPLIVPDNEDGEFKIRLEFEDTIRELYEEKPDFTYLEEGPALFRIYATQVSKGYTGFKKRVASPSGVVYLIVRNVDNKFFQKYHLDIIPKVGNMIEYSVLLNDCKKECMDGESVELRNMFSSLNEKFDNKIEFIIEGNKNKRLRIAYKYKFSDFDIELEAMQRICNEFFTEAVKDIELLCES